MRFSVFFIFIFCFFTVFSLQASAAFGEAIDKSGNSLTWTVYSENGKNSSRAAKKAMAQLRKNGYKKVRSTVKTKLEHGHYVVVFSAYWGKKGVLKKSFGFGFSSKSVEDAKQKAVKNLKKYAKGWKKSEGFVVKNQGEF